MGGECESGPGSDGACGCKLSACQPVRSLRDVRRLVGIGAAVLTVGFLLIVLGDDPYDASINAGTLTTAHSGGSLDCASCHAETSPADLVKVVDPHFLSERSFANSELCLNCHGDEIGDWVTSARFAHGWTEKVVAEKISVAKEISERDEALRPELALWIAAKGPLPTKGALGELACATCHQEHHGSDYIMTELTNQQCQVCHQNQFHGFSEGHPSFQDSGYPYSRRTRIFFDHEEHYQKHFEGSSDVVIEGFDPKQPFASGESCTHCHVSDEKGEFMKLKGYEVTCAGCHDQEAAEADRLTLFTIPALGQEGFDGQWPLAGYGLGPAGRLLLEPNTGAALFEIGVDEDFGAVALDSAEVRNVAELVAADLQQLSHEYWSNGAAVLAERIEQNGYASAEISTELFGGLSVDTVRNFLFPGIQWDLGDFSFPSLDLETMDEKLASKSRSIGAWPTQAGGALSPLMVHLLSHRPEIVSEIVMLAPFANESGGFELSNLGEADQDQIAAVEKIAWAIRELFFEMRQSGAPFLEQFESLRGGIIDLEKTEAVLSRVFYAASNDAVFLEEVEEQLSKFRSGSYPEALQKADSPVSNDQSAAGKADDDFGASEPEPAAGGDDDFGAGDDDFGASEPEPAAGGDDDFGAGDDDFGASEPEPAADGDDDFGAGDDDFGASEPEPAAGGDDDFGAGDDDFGASEPEPAAGGDDDFGAGDDDFGASEPEPAAGGDDDFGAGDDDFGASEPEPAAGGDDDFGASDSGTPEKVEDSVPKKTFRSFEPSLYDWNKTGGWHYEQQAIHYSTRGHADPVIRAWIETSVSALNSSDAIHRKNGRLILNYVLDWKKGVSTAASGKCLKCHSIDRDSTSGVYQVNWHEAYGDLAEANESSDLTRFSHIKHSIAVDCINCHVPKEGGDYADFFPARNSRRELTNPALFSPNFLPINEKETCASCHQEGLSGENCLQCHEYHSRN